MRVTCPQSSSVEDARRECYIGNDRLLHAHLPVDASLTAALVEGLTYWESGSLRACSSQPSGH